MATPRDPYQYYRIEAKELVEGLGRGVLELEKGPVSAETVARLLRIAHTFKGAARVVKQAATAELAHAMEDALAGLRDGAPAAPPGLVRELLRIVDAMTAHLVALDAPKSPPAPSGGAPQPPADERMETVRVDLADLDRLLEAVAEASVQLEALRSEIGALRRARQVARGLDNQLDSQRGRVAAELRSRAAAREVAGTLDRVERSASEAVERAGAEVERIREAATRMRLLPAGTVASTLERAARDTADALDKHVDFRMTGEDVRLDAHVLAVVRGALLHVVKNAVAHGIESPTVRAASGKPTRGAVLLAVERRGSRVVFTCRDDGRGIDEHAVRGAAIRHGLVTEADAAGLGSDEVARLVFEAGLSTASRVTADAGRGVGLDVVLDAARQLKGDVEIATTPGKGMTVELRLPVTLTSLDALAVEAGGAVAAIPLDAVRRVLYLGDRDVTRSAEGERVVYDGDVIPLFQLAPALVPGRAREGSSGARSAVVVEARGGRAAVLVDRLLGTRNVLARPLPELAPTGAVVAGASLDARGNPELLLDPAGLLDAAHAAGDPLPIAASAPPRPILVIDDSLTTRILEQSILESAGYEVDLAVSGEEAIAKARDRQYAVFVVDVEMPGMDGFEFVEKTRADPVLSATPAVLVTSRNAPEDVRRGREAGAAGYVVKGDFDQSELLRLIRRLAR